MYTSREMKFKNCLLTMLGNLKQKTWRIVCLSRSLFFSFAYKGFLDCLNGYLDLKLEFHKSFGSTCSCLIHGYWTDNLVLIVDKIALFMAGLACWLQCDNKWSLAVLAYTFSSLSLSIHAQISAYENLTSEPMLRFPGPMHK